MHIPNESAGKGHRERNLASTGNLQQPQSRCRGAMPGDVVHQGKGCWGRPGQQSCWKQNFTMFRHCCLKQEQARGKVSHNSRQWRQQRIQLSPTTFIQLHLQEVAGGSALEDIGKTPSGHPLSTDNVVCWGQLCVCQARHRACLSLKIKVWGLWSASTCTRKMYSGLFISTSSWWLSLWLYFTYWIALHISSSGGSQMGSRVGQGTSKTPQHINCRKKGEDRQSWTWSHSLFSRIPVNSVTPSRLGCSEGPTWCQETLMVSQPIIQHETSLWPLYHTCPLYWGLGLPPEGLFPLITFRSRTKTGISACAQPYTLLSLPNNLFLWKSICSPFWGQPSIPRSSSGINPTRECVSFVTSCYNPQKWIYPHNVRNETQKHPQRRWRSKLVVDYQILKRL